MRWAAAAMGMLALVGLWVHAGLEKERAKVPVMEELPELEAVSSEGEDGWGDYEEIVRGWRERDGDEAEALATASKALKLAGAPSEGLDAWEPWAAELDRFEKLAEHPRIAVPFRGYDDSAPIMESAALVKLGLLRAWDRAADGLYPEATGEMVRLVVIGERLRRGSGDALSLLGSVILVSWPLGELAELLETPAGEDATSLRVVVEGLRPLLRGGSSAPSAVVQECRHAESQIADIPEAADGLVERMALTFFYDEETTIAWMRAQCRVRLAAAQGPLLERGEPEYTWLLDRESLDVFQWLHNPIGRGLADMYAVNNVWRLPDAEDAARASLAVVVTAAAARGYRAEHGSLPDSLADGFPGWLEPLPIDPIDLQPIRVTHDAVWSAGRSRDLPGNPTLEVSIR